jgi:hypothetical protein
MSLSRLAVGVMLVCGVEWSAAALAADPPFAPGQAQQANHSPPASNPQAASVDGFGQAISTSSLSHYSGGSSLVQANANLTGNLTGDSASQVTGGPNSINGDSFAGASGLSAVIQNSGSNVLIQNGVAINVAMKP